MIQDDVLINDWHALARSSDVVPEKPVAARLLGEDLVLWRSKDGTIHAWRDLCIHRGAKLSLGKTNGTTLSCPYHGWVYDTEGRCVRFPAHPEQCPPAKAQARVFRARERYDTIWVSLGQPEQDIPPFAEWDDPDFKAVVCGPYTVRAGGPRLIENFLDVAHFPFVHTGSLGDLEHTTLSDYTVEVTAEEVVANDITVWQPDPLGVGHGAYMHYVYKVLRPLTAYLAKQADDTSGLALLFTITPVDVDHSLVWTYEATTTLEESDEEIIKFQESILFQDIPVVESQRPELLPLDLQAELHLRSDRLSIAYRRWLREKGVTFGTA
ncbi:aromatic ring-hydroxylating dioxygenase subunit alpha [Tengunoibacter tsumagoiensis]|uniref:Chlorophyll a oxygenase n=1 Tax=Tengunoibacter tsumagoiensis TaxID=2014871 RepID=A0A401ZTU1_9CHLR|nr:aromatic ring-hydroxylating dioxygenase subunit alpha [Tengunoibacter tsumagoiensis]GCE10216.1 chlorophyll a oxygenase [Tengunoibacter tsumagoiensis]